MFDDTIRTKMRKYHTLPAIILLAVAIVLMMVGSVPKAVSVVLLILAALLLVFLSRGNLYFSRAVNIVRGGKKDKYPKAIELFTKALKAGLPPKFQVVAASMLLQNGKTEEAKSYLEPLTKDSDKQIAQEAAVTLSMYYWYIKDLDKAIELCEEVKANGKADKNLYINLATYYLKAGRTRDFKDLIKEIDLKKYSSAAMIDFNAVNALLEKNWKRAGQLLYSLLDDISPSFADPYVHLAMVYLHYGKLDEAVKYLRKGQETRFTATAIYNKEDIVKLADALENPEENLSAAIAVNRSTLDMVNGTLPSWSRNTGDDIRQSFPDLPDFFSQEAAAADDDEVEEDDDDVNTDITEDDEEWLRRHKD